MEFTVKNKGTYVFIISNCHRLFFKGENHYCPVKVD